MPTSDIHFLIAQPIANMWIMKTLASRSLECGSWLELRLPCHVSSCLAKPSVSLLKGDSKVTIHYYFLWHLEAASFHKVTLSSYFRRSKYKIQFGIDDGFSFGGVILRWFPELASLFLSQRQFLHLEESSSWFLIPKATIHRLLF